MKKQKESGKAAMVKGSIAYLIEELKTMNVNKLKALSRVMAGYARMKLVDKRKQQSAKRDDVEEVSIPPYL